mgnify:FL=1
MKNDLRTALRKKRGTISPLRRSRDSKKIALHILNSTELNLGNRLGLYFALKHEVNTKMLINAFLNVGKKIFLPVIEKEKLFFGRYDPKITNITENRYGIGEPSKEDTKMVPPASLDTVFFPIVGFNNNFYRIGMGGGFYDRSFKDLEEDSPTRIGLAFSFQKVTFEPERHDIPLFAICTEDGISIRKEKNKNRQKI